MTWQNNAIVIQTQEKLPLFLIFSPRINPPAFHFEMCCSIFCKNLQQKIVVLRKHCKKIFASLITHQFFPTSVLMRFNRKSSHKLSKRKSSNVDLLYSLTADRFVTWIQIGIPALYVKKGNRMRFFSCFLA